ncbi:MAG: long-chain acyl-CoA synthetase [Frankiales bacterium]|nr:long-chain acyl-CoA synthetase [Frankiales bacterium]
MQEYTTPATLVLDEAANLTDLVFRNADEAPDFACFARREGSEWRDVTSVQFRDEVVGLAKGLVAAGIEPGDRVAIMSKTRYEWSLADFAIWTAGAVPVPIYETSSAEQVEWILSDSSAVAAFVESEKHEGIVADLRDRLPKLANVWRFETGAVDTLTAGGADVDEAEIDRRRKTLNTESMATLIYTSGTTGRPKGCELTHGNFLFDAMSVSEATSELWEDGKSTLLFLPLAHVFARVIEVSCVFNRVQVAHSADIKNLLADFADFKPSFILSVPRVFEKVYTTAKQKAHADGKGKLFDRAESIAVKYSQGMDRGAAGPLVKLEHAVWERLVYGKLRAALGGRVEYAVSGGAPLGARLGHFFRGIGVTILEGYGLTETTAGATLNTPQRMKVGSVGQPIPGVTVRIADDGEILLKGGLIFRGYWHNPDASKEALEGDGWFHTGDIGEIDADGFLKITGRKKELIVTAGGKNVAPAVLEERLQAHRLVSQAMVVGDNQPFIAALVTIDPEAFPTWLKEKGKSEGASVADLVDDADLVAEIQTAVDNANKAVSQAEAIRKFQIMPVDWTEEGGQLTPTLKLKRSVVAKECAADIEALYG